MAFSFANISIFNARVGTEPELKTTKGGLELLSFRCVTNKKIGEEEVATWYAVSLFGRKATSLHGRIHKGDLVSVAGDFASREYTGRDGSARTSLDVTAQNVVTHGGGASGGARPAESDDSIPF